MDFELNEEQRDLRDHVAEFARAEVAPIAERLDAEATFPTALYRKVGDLASPRFRSPRSSADWASARWT
jgi:alkylation response protein AidB-like acyl-CoA dehydrogenase